jgi:hypothetical protein
MSGYTITDPDGSVLHVGTPEGVVTARRDARARRDALLDQVRRTEGRDFELELDTAINDYLVQRELEVLAKFFSAYSSSDRAWVAAAT